MLTRLFRADRPSSRLLLGRALGCGAQIGLPGCDQELGKVVRKRRPRLGGGL